MITSKDNKKVKYARSLHYAKNRKANKQFLIEGRKLVNAARACNSVDFVLTCDNTIDGIYVSREVLKTVTQTVSDIDVVAVCNDLNLKSEFRRVLVLDNIQDPGNLGTLVRSALAFNFDSVVCSKNCVDIYNSKALRASGGAIFHIPVIYKDLEEYLSQSSNCTVGTFVDGDVKIELPKDINLVIGNEGKGISKNVSRLCDKRFRIDINSNIESLNAAVAGSVLMWQIGGNNEID